MRTLTPTEREMLVMQLASLRPEVAAFALAMEDKLRQNDHKGGWDDCSKQYMAMRLTQEREELRDAIARGAPPEEILKEAADVANFAMMVADLVGGLGAVVALPESRPLPLRPASYVETQRIEPKLRWKKLSVAERIALREEHRGMSEHELSEADWIPRVGESFQPRGIGHDETPGCFVCGGEPGLYHNVAAFVVSKASGERVVAMFDQGARLAYSEGEPDRVQVKIGACEADLRGLKYLSTLRRITRAEVTTAIIKARSREP